MTVYVDLDQCCAVSFSMKLSAPSNVNKGWRVALEVGLEYLNARVAIAMPFDFVRFLEISYLIQDFTKMNL